MNTPIASGSRSVVFSRNFSLSSLNTDQFEPPSESSPSTNGLTDGSEDSEEDDIISEDDSEDDEPASTSSAVNRRVERTLKRCVAQVQRGS